jgi:catechol 2,3-dioxygenase-like lactoylglutathione lyase family enzyme
MSRFMLNAMAIVCLATLGISGQTRTLPYDHIHVNVPDPAAAANWYEKYFGGKRITEAPDRLMFGSTRFMFLRKADAQPSAGSAIDHVGFSVADLDATMKTLEAAGIKVTSPVRDVPGLFKLAFVEDPWGTRIEVVEDPETLGFHHILLHSNDPDAALNWYHDMCGGQKAKLKGQTDAIRYGKIWLLAVRPTPRDTKLVPTEGRSIDHLGFSFPDLDSAARDFEQRGTKLRQQPQAANNPGVSRAGSLVGPDDVLIEIVQPLPALK